MCLRQAENPRARVIRGGVDSREHKLAAIRREGESPVGLRSIGKLVIRLGSTETTDTERQDPNCESPREHPCITLAIPPRDRRLDDARSRRSR